MGHTKLCSSNFRPAFILMTDNLIKLVRANYRFADKTKYPVFWGPPRPFNGVADALCTHTMNKKASWHNTWPDAPEQAHGLKANLLAFLGGGSRMHWRSSAGA